MEIHFIMHLLEPGSVILLKPKQAVCILSNLLGDWGPTLTLSPVLMCFSQQPFLSIIWLGIFTSERGSITKMLKFLSQRSKKPQFYGNRLTDSQRIYKEELIAVESTSSGIFES